MENTIKTLITTVKGQGAMGSALAQVSNSAGLAQAIGLEGAKVAAIVNAAKIIVDQNPGLSQPNWPEPVWDHFAKLLTERASVQQPPAPPKKDLLNGFFSGGGPAVATPPRPQTPNVQQQPVAIDEIIETMSEVSARSLRKQDYDKFRDFSFHPEGDLGRLLRAAKKQFNTVPSPKEMQNFVEEFMITELEGREKRIEFIEICDSMNLVLAPFPKRGEPCILSDFQKGIIGTGERQAILDMAKWRGKDIKSCIIAAGFRPMPEKAAGFETHHGRDDYSGGQMADAMNKYFGGMA